ncbi:MAG: hypothetical protein UR93_C0012G0005 [Berkelbacteria bacterium GW2011_GWA2_35_9]|uniref:Uncharacterized protein n=1 Tax=Berkelbacteria bacterium GW2011_GWA2_35_9 TaxID=1618333 RepID=A0A0G0G9X7_9BACT|nr:MAG: hypothetical protein UR93_C0012G0005 [Berkelbacteria bacterium GW2011_GWA2_35_9]
MWIKNLDNNKNTGLSYLITVVSLIFFILVLTVEFNVVYNGYKHDNNNGTSSVVNQKGFEKIINKIIK